MVSTRNYKFRLYPNDSQEYKLQNNLAVCRWVYNRFVGMARNGFITRNDCNYMLTEIKQTEDWLYQYHSKMLQSISTQIDGAQKGIIEKSKKGHKTGSLRFCKYYDYRTFTYSQSGFKFEKKGTTDLLYLSKIGYVEIRPHRPIPQNSTIKQVIVTKTPSGKWFACVTVDKTEPLVEIPKISFSKSVGIDVGIKSFVYDSNGFQTPNPKNLQKMLKPLKRIQRKVSRRKKGSNNRLKAILHMQKIHEKIANRRNDFQHKLSTIYAKNNDVVFVEKLHLTNMVKNHKLAQSIADASWSSFVQKLEYKCKMLVKVEPRDTTVDCSRCGNKVPKGLAIRIHRCDKCDLVLDRDHNASLNILNRGLNLSAKVYYELPQELREVTLVESAMHSMKQEKVIRLVGW
ncbi:RNA-guided endonuclease InsQ/TnpB family protein [Nitrosopumilus sp.]|uniref:RNA-guided endonuclease InsQ/TnpB family protein n=1 Tax=Nitrosopumilus sp. TaxID=2024843 RepID=UPI0034A03264